MSDYVTGNRYFDFLGVDLEPYRNDPFEFQQLKYMEDLGKIDESILTLEVLIYLNWLQKVWEATASLPGEVESMDLFELQLDIKGRQAMVMGYFIFYEEDGQSYQDFIEEVREIDIDELWENPCWFFDLELLNQELEKCDLAKIEPLSWDNEWPSDIPERADSDSLLRLIERMITYYQDPLGLDVEWRESTSQLDRLERAETLYQRVLDEVTNVSLAHFIQELFIELAESEE